MTLEDVGPAVVCAEVVDLFGIDEKEEIFADEFDDVEVSRERGTGEGESEGSARSSSIV